MWNPFSWFLLVYEAGVGKGYALARDCQQILLKVKSSLPWFSSLPAGEPDQQCYLAGRAVGRAAGAQSLARRTRGGDS